MTEETPEREIVLRPMRPDDRAAIAALAARAFPPTQAPFVASGEAGGVVALVDGAVAAASLHRVFRLPSGARVGMVAWLMTDPDTRGLGLASRLVARSVERLREDGCAWIVTDVEGYNTASANIFHGVGFRRLGLGEQSRLWGPVGLAWVWLRARLVLDPGHFLWVAGGVRPSSALDPSASEVGCSAAIGSRLGAILSNAVVAILSVAVGGGLFLSAQAGIPDAAKALAILAGVAILLLVREAAMRVGAGRGPRLVFRAWQGGWGIALGIVAGFGSVLPLPGNLYPAGDGWRMRDHVPRLGRAAVASALAIAALVLAASFLRGLDAPRFLHDAALAIVFVGKPLLVFDTVIAVAPFDGFNARRLRDRHRPTWLALASLAVLVVLFG